MCFYLQVSDRFYRDNTQELINRISIINIGGYSTLNLPGKLINKCLINRKKVVENQLFTSITIENPHLILLREKRHDVTVKRQLTGLDGKHEFCGHQRAQRTGHGHFHVYQQSQQAVKVSGRN